MAPLQEALLGPVEHLKEVVEGPAVFLHAHCYLHALLHRSSFQEYTLRLYYAALRQQQHTRHNPLSTVNWMLDGIVR